MDAWVIILIVVALLALLALGGNLAQRRRMEQTAGRFSANLDRVNNDLAAAHAADNGWEPSRVGGAARAAFAEQRPGEHVREMALVQVIDPPGTDDDKAVFRVGQARDGELLTLGRRDGAWVAERIE